jgi:hypothetical protein
MRSCVYFLIFTALASATADDRREQPGLTATELAAGLEKLSPIEVRRGEVQVFGNGSKVVGVAKVGGRPAIILGN